MRKDNFLLKEASKMRSFDTQRQDYPADAFRRIEATGRREARLARIQAWIWGIGLVGCLILMGVEL